MDEDVTSVVAEDDQELAADILSRYDLLTLPVVDKNKMLLGIITADDVIDVLKEKPSKTFISLLVSTPARKTRSLTTTCRARLRQDCPG